MLNKLEIGTAQFGLDYGIHNKSGQIPPENIEVILKLGQVRGVDSIDTASVYGSSETVLGTTGQLFDYKVYTKGCFPYVGALKQEFEASCKRLRLSSLEGYYFHRFLDITERPQLIEEALSLRREGKIRKIGFSVYYPKEVQWLLANEIPFDLLQFPLNLFDNRFVPLLPRLKQRQIELHARSIFLQGLFFMELSSLPKHFEGVKEPLAYLQEYADGDRGNIARICLEHGLRNEFIDRIVVGFDSLDQLEFAINVQKSFSQEDKGKNNGLKNLSIVNEQIVIPSNWRL